MGSSQPPSRGVRLGADKGPHSQPAAAPSLRPPAPQKQQGSDRRHPHIRQTPGLPCSHRFLKTSHLHCQALCGLLRGPAMLLLLCLETAGKRHREPSALAEVLGSLNEAVPPSREASQMKLKASELPHHYFLVCTISSGGILMYLGGEHKNLALRNITARWLGRAWGQAAAGESPHSLDPIACSSPCPCSLVPIVLPLQSLVSSASSTALSSVQRQPGGPSPSGCHMHVQKQVLAS